MLFSTNTNSTANLFGLSESVKKISDAGFPAIDISFFKKKIIRSFLIKMPRKAWQKR